MICAIATPCAMAAYNATMNTDIPVIYTAVSDPVEAGLANEDGTPVGNHHRYFRCTGSRCTVENDP